MTQQVKILKISVATGIFWVEIPDVDLRILCGCPMDSIKHLMKRGLIIETEKAGVHCETGPNTILLSDEKLQNGEFSNLGEFPVLQMLYKQGLILPNHPNNTGQKPLIIGSAEQVNAQMQYIYRGNYGLVSKEEMTKYGVDAETAARMMRLKLKFAFGAIRPTKDLLDSCVVEDGVCEIRDGVRIRRQANNIFEFEYQGEKVTVNLNLSSDECFDSAYPLGFQCLPREYFAVIHSGEGDGWDVNRPSMSSILMFQGKIYLIDAGPNIAENLSALGIGIDEIEGIFHTHAHDDHFAGVTTLLRAGHKIKYYASPLVRASVEKKIAALLSIEAERFGDFFDIVDLEVDSWNDIQGLEVKPIISPHPLETTIFIFRTLWGDGYKTYAHFADIVALDVLKGMIETDPSKPGITEEYFHKVKDEYLTTVDLKKLDIGGGMIHGMAKDFKKDKSRRILLSHLARELTKKEKEIGSYAPFGMMDILISGQSDFSRRSAFSFLQSALPDIHMHHLRILINNPVTDFNPGVTILKEGQIAKYIYLILTGSVEKIRTSENLYSHLYSGAFVGELYGLYGIEAKSTYNAVGYVRALKIPVALYVELIERNNLMPRIEQTWKNRAFLESISLFSEGIPYLVFAKILDSIKTKAYKAGEIVSCRDTPELNVIKSGAVARSVGGKQLDRLETKDYFGEEVAVFDTPCLFRMQAIEDVEVIQISGDLLKDIPILRWKLYEAYLKRATLVLHAGTDSGSFRWNTEFAIQILEMDTHHKKIVEIANGIIESLRSNDESGTLSKTMNSLVDYTEHHFTAEEKLMEVYGYDELPQHQEKHHSLLLQVRNFQKDLQKQKNMSVKNFRSFFVGWIIKHILNEDRKYAAFLHAKGVY